MKILSDIKALQLYRNENKNSVKLYFFEENYTLFRENLARIKPGAAKKFINLAWI